MSNAIDQQFYFKKMDRFQMSTLVASKLPISLKNLEPLINRVYDRYPLVERSMLIDIVKKTFEVIRERLIVGEKVSLDGLANSTQLYFNRGKSNCVRARIHLTTPHNLAKDIND